MMDRLAPLAQAALDALGDVLVESGNQLIQADSAATILLYAPATAGADDDRLWATMWAQRLQGLERPTPEETALAAQVHARLREEYPSATRAELVWACYAAALRSLLDLDADIL